MHVYKKLKKYLLERDYRQSQVLLFKGTPIKLCKHNWFKLTYRTCWTMLITLRDAASLIWTSFHTLFSFPPLLLSMDSGFRSFLRSPTVHGSQIGKLLRPFRSSVVQDGTWACVSSSSDGHSQELGWSVGAQLPVLTSDPEAHFCKSFHSNLGFSLEISRRGAGCDSFF